MSVLDLQIEEGSLQGTEDYLEQTRLNILSAIRQGMQEGMDGLAAGIAEKLHGDPITSHTGDLENFILRSAKVFSETENDITGVVTARTAKFRNLGLWLEFGTKYPTQGNNLDAYPHQFLPGTPESARTMGHGAFRIEPKPFFNPTFQDYYPTILDTIQQRIAEACDV